MAELELREVSYLYSVGTPFQKTAINNINIKFSSGKITGLIGHTGSGKSTLVQMLNGLLRPNEGTVLLDGADIWAEPKNIRALRFKVGLVFQYPEYQLFEETVYKDIAYGPSNMGLSDADIKARVANAARFCGITEDMMDKSPFELSGGQKRRVAIAGVIAMDPEVIVLDEPAAGLDPKGREDILGGLRSYQREKKNTMIIVSHSMEDMARYSDEIAVMKGGEIFAHGNCADIFGDSNTLREAGLDVPQITAFTERLSEYGITLSEKVYTVERATELISILLSDKKRREADA